MAKLAISQIPKYGYFGKIPYRIKNIPHLRTVRSMNQPLLKRGDYSGVGIADGLTVINKPQWPDI